MNAPQLLAQALGGHLAAPSPSPAATATTTTTPPASTSTPSWAVRPLLLKPALTERRDFQHAYTRLYLRSGGIAASPRRWGDHGRFPQELDLLVDPAGTGAQVGAGGASSWAIS